MEIRQDRMADWGQGNPSHPDYIKGRTHYINEVGVKYTGTSITLTASGGYAQGSMYGYNSYPDGFWDLAVVGNFMRLTVGVQNFEGEIKQGIASGVYIGNGYIHNPNMPDTGEDWCYYCDSAGFDSFHLMCDESMAGTYNTVVYPYELVYVPLDERFIPDTIARDGEVVHIDGEETVTGVKNFSNGLQIGGQSVVWDSVNQCLKVVFN